MKVIKHIIIMHTPLLICKSLTNLIIFQKFNFRKKMNLIEALNSCFDFVDKIDKNNLYYAIILFTTLMFLWENYLSFRQVFFKSIFVVYNFLAKTYFNLVFSRKDQHKSTRRIIKRHRSRHIYKISFLCSR